MAAQIIWTDQALKDYEAVKSYLLSEFGDAAVTKFLTILFRKLDLIAIHPHLFPATTKRADLRKAVIHKRLILFYRYKSRTGEIQLITLFDTRRKPQ